MKKQKKKSASGVDRQVEPWVKQYCRDPKASVALLRSCTIL